MATETPKSKTSGGEDGQPKGAATWQDKAIVALKTAAGCVAVGFMTAAGSALFHRSVGTRIGAVAPVVPIRKVP